jgi:hypothetical protein
MPMFLCRREPVRAWRRMSYRRAGDDAREKPQL